VRLVLLIAGSALFACSNVLGIDELPKKPANAIDHVAAACGTCVDRACKLERDKCANDGECVAAYQCLSQCPPNAIACRGKCEADHPVAVKNGSFYRTLDACRRGKCPNECYGNAGLGALTGAGCECLDEQCPMLKCVQSGAGREGAVSGACDLTFGCQAQHDDIGSFLECRAVHPTSDPEWAEMYACRKRPCGKCTAGENWNCAHKFTWPSTCARSVPYLTTIQGATGAGLKDATVTICAANDCEKCTTGMSAGTTDAEGHIKLTLPIASTCNGFLGCLRVEKPGYVPTIGHFGRPITQYEDDWIFGAFTDLEIAGVYALGGFKEVPRDRGGIVSIAFDCSMIDAPGITIDPLGPDSKVLYASEGFKLDPALTASTHVGGFVMLNVVPGRYTLTGRKNGEVVATADVTISAYTVTTTSLFAAPR
jgi:hypothetical protein